MRTALSKLSHIPELILLILTLHMVCLIFIWNEYETYFYQSCRVLNAMIWNYNLYPPTIRHFLLRPATKTRLSFRYSWHL